MASVDRVQRRGGWWLVGLLLVGCSRDAVPRSAGNGQRWLEVVTPHFVLSTNQIEPTALDTARALEEARASLLALAWTGARNPPRGRVDVMVFQSPGEFNRYCGLKRPVAGVAFERAGERRLLSFHPGPENGIPSVIVHELAHYLSDWFMPIQPPWFAEGLATYLETTRYDRSQRSATMGAIEQHHVEWLRATRVLMGSKTLFATTEQLHDNPNDTTAFYSSSWLLVHYLLNRDDERFGEFQRRLSHLEDWRHAWQEVFADSSNERLDQQLVAYASKAEFLTLSGPVQVEAYEPQLRVLSEAERHGVLAELASLQQPKLAQQEAQAALLLDPNELNALRVRFQALGADATSERSAVARRAVAAHPDRAEAWWLLARTENDAGKAESALQQAQRLEPEHPGVALQMALDRLERGESHAALPLTSLALRRSGASFQTLSAHLRALVGERECDDALRLQGTIEGLARDACTNGQIDATTCLEPWRQSSQLSLAPCARSHMAVSGRTAAPAPTSAETEAAGPAREGAGEVKGFLAPERIRETVRPHYPEFRNCYQAGLTRNPELRGRVTLRFAIERDGKVSHVSVAETDLSDFGVLDCIRAAFRRMEFPTPQGNIVTVQYPIQLQPESD